MKKKILPALLFAAALMTASCSDDSESVPATLSSRSISLSATMPSVGNDTRTGIITENSLVRPTWTKGDFLDIIYDRIGDNGAIWTMPLEKDTEHAIFTFNVTDEEASKMEDFENSREFYAVSNNLHVQSYFNKENVMLYIGKAIGDESAGKNSIDRKSEALVSNVVPVSSVKPGVPVELQFKRINALLRLNILDKTSQNMLTGTAIKYIELGEPRGEFDPGKLFGNSPIHLTGFVYYNINTGSIDVSYADKPIKLDIDESDPVIIGEENCYAYATCVPTSFGWGDRLELNFYASEHYVTKILNIFEPMELKPGEITTLNITITDENIIY